MDEKMRLTSHSARTGKDGAYSPKHNDRNFDTSKAEHIDPSRSGGNWYWHCYQDAHPEMTFEEVEKAFYEDHFAKALEAQNKRHIEAGHKSRVRTMDQYREFKLSCPEEIIVQIGKDGQTVDPELLRKICIQHINWMQKKYPNIRILNVALHVDEEGAPHMHIRLVWIGHKNGLEVVGQNKALEEMGIARPHPEKPKDRHNNAKMTYTRECRDYLIKICKQHGLEIEEEPKETSKSGLSHLEYKSRQEEEKLQALKKEIQQLQEERQQLQKEHQRLQKEIAETKLQIAEQQEEIRHIHTCNRKMIESLQDILTALRSVSVENAADMEQIRIVIKELEDVIDGLENTLTASPC